jgi:hypothetical protein
MAGERVADVQGEDDDFEVIVDEHPASQAADHHPTAADATESSASANSETQKTK